MLTLNVQNLGGVTILRCQGRIVTGDESTILRSTALAQTDNSTLVLDLAQVAGIDAGGLGALLDLQTWTRSKGIRFKFANVPSSVQHLLEVTKLEGVFEICSQKELDDLLHRAADKATVAGTVPR